MINDKINLIPPVDKRKNTLCSLFYIALCVSCSVFMCINFLQNPKPNNPGKISWTAHYTAMYFYTNLETLYTMPKRIFWT